MNEKTPNDFDSAKDDAPHERSLEEHLEGIGTKSNGASVKAAVTAALKDNWSRADVRKALEALRVGETKIKKAFPPAPKPHVPAATGLSPGYFRKDDESVWTFVTDPMTGEPIEVPVCSPIEVQFRTTDSEGGDASIVITITNIHGEKRQMRLSAALARTDIRAAASQLFENGLIPAYRGEKLYAEILDMILGADVSHARYVSETGHFAFHGAKGFALPSGILGAQPGVTVIWDGDARQCRASKAGTLDKWLTTVVLPCDGNAIPQVAIGAMLASPAIPYLPQTVETNTMIHLVEITTTGKTTTIRIAASVWGPGRATSDPISFVMTWRTTGNASETQLAGHNHIGICLDELVLVDAKAAGTWAHEFASGRGKHRLNRDASSKRQRGWELFPLSSGNVTLEERASDAAPTKRRTVDAAADVRVLNIPAKDIFINLHGFEDAKTFAEELAKRAATVYGHAGPAFVEWLLTNEDEARAQIEKYQTAWTSFVENKVLPKSASDQAKRVASRLGVIACCAALGADVLKLPWSDKGVANRPAPAMLRAFTKVLKLWLDANGGGGASTEIIDLISAMDEFIATRIRHFVKLTKSVVTSSDGVAIEREAAVDGGLYPASPRWGWIKMKSATAETKAKARLENLPEPAEEIDYMDLNPSLFTDPQGLGWTARKRERLMQELKARGHLIHDPPSTRKGRSDNRLTFKTRVEGKPIGVYRIKGKHFEE